MISAASKVVGPLLVFLLVQPMAAHTEDASPSSPPVPPSKAAALNATAETARNSVAEMKTPANVLELMENLRDALRNRLVFDEAFYTQENVKKITAGQQINVIRHQKKPVLEVEAFDFRTIADNLESYGGGLSIDMALYTEPGRKKRVAIHGSISSDQPLLNYRAIEKMVGHAWQVSMPRPFGSNQLYQAPTDPHGNAEREYRRQDGDIEEKGSFRFNPAGHLRSFLLESVEK